VGWNLGKKVRPLIDSTMSQLARFVAPILEIFQVKLEMVLEVRFNSLFELRLVVFDADHEITPPSTMSWAISFWQPMASIVINESVSLICFRRWGIAVISFDFSSVTT
jgi:hypothetical protein